MKKSQFTMAMIGPIREAIEYDLQRYEAGELDGFRFLVYAKDVGMLVPHKWIDKFPEWKEKWGKFMEGQGVSAAGFYIRDVSRFLNILQRNCTEDRTL